MAQQHDHHDPALAHQTAHGATKKEIFTIAGVLTGLTLLELGVVYMHLPRALLVTSLIGLALGKAYLVAMYYMHLKGETRPLRLVVFIPLMFPALYALILIFEAAFRMLMEAQGGA